MRVAPLLLAILLSCSLLQAETRWPQFRGPAGNGISSEQNLPTEWSASNIAWRTELKGTGLSSPCVWDNRIFVTSAQKDDEKVKRFVICLDRRDGRVLWQQAATSGVAEKSHGMNSLATATCATDGERVVAFFGKAGIHCFDMDGKRLWTHDTGQLPSPWGTAASPIIAGKWVIQNCDATGPSSLLALDKKTGAKAWQTPRQNMPRGGWSTPLVINTGARQELILNGEHGINAYDPATGKDLWFCKGFSGRGTPMPVFANGLVVVMSAKTGDTYCVRPGGSGNVTQSHMTWHTPRPRGRVLASPAISGNFMLAVALDGASYCHDIRSGELLWSEKLPGRYTASPIVARDLFYVLNETGDTLIVRPGKTLDIVTTNTLNAAAGEIFRACIVPCHGQLLLRSTQAVYCTGKDPQ